MSYILNALKKSEKQRQANQAESLESRILQQPQDEHKKAPYWLIILVFVNVCFLAYFIWSFLIEDESSEPLSKPYIKETANQITIDKPIHRPSINLAEKQQQTSISELIENQQKKIDKPIIKQQDKKEKTIATETKSVNKPLKKQSAKLATENIVLPEIAAIAVIEKPEKSIDQLISKQKANIAKSIATEAKPVIKPLIKQTDKLTTENIALPEIAAIAVIKKPAKSIDQPISKQKENNAKTITTEAKPVDKPLIKQTDKLATENIALPETAPLAVIEKPEDKLNKVDNGTNNLPFLTEIDSDFRRTVPTVDMNVFVYSDNEAERFIMIDMQKYQTGELIKNGMTLKEIRRNSIIVEYNNRVFKIKRN